MKIAMIGHKRIPTREGGIEIVVYELARRLVKMGNEVDVYNRHTDEAKISECEGAKVYEIKTFKSSKLNAQFYSFCATLKAITKHYDVIHYHAIGSCAMLWIPHMFGIRTVATIHGLDYNRAKWNWFAKKYLYFGEKTAVKYADEIIVLSSDTQKYFREKYGRETHFIPNGVNPAEPREASVIKEKYGLSKDDYILFLARLTCEKGLDYLIEAYKNLDTDKKLLICGRDEPETEYIRALKEKAAPLGDKVIFTGLVQGNEWREIFTNCFVYVLPSDIEGLPLSLLEAVSFGVPCLASDISENRQISEDYIYFFKKGDAKDLEEKLRFMLNNADKKQTNFSADITAADKDKMVASVLEKYSWDTITAETLKLYKGEKI